MWNTKKGVKLTNETSRSNIYFSAKLIHVDFRETVEVNCLENEKKLLRQNNRTATCHIVLKGPLTG